MKKFSRLLALVLALMLVLGVAVAETADTPETEETIALADDVLITVGGRDVTRAQVEMILSNLMSSYAQYGYDTSDPSFVSVMQQYAVKYAVQLEVMKLKGAEMGLDQISEEDMAELTAENAAQWNELVDAYVTYYGGVTDESTEEEIAAARLQMLSQLETMGYTEAIMLQNTLENYTLDRVEEYMIQGAVVTDEDIAAYFQEKVLADQEAYANDVGTYEYVTQYYGETAYYIPEGYRGVTHILLEVDAALLENYQSLNAALEEQEDHQEDAEAAQEKVTQEQVDAARQAIIDSVQPTIDEINQKLAEGAAFADLIVEYGTDPGMDDPITRAEGYSVHMDSVIYDPVFVQAAFSVNSLGEVSAPAVSSFGVHLVHYTRDIRGGAVEFTPDMELALHEELLGEKENEQFYLVMEGWLETCEVNYSQEAQAMLDAGAAVE